MTPSHLTLVGGGTSNSRPTPESWNRSGIDTVRYRFRTDADAYTRFAQSGPHYEGSQGELYRQEDGIRVGAHRSGMLYAEGRLAAILHRPDDHSLRRLEEVAEGAERAAKRFGFSIDTNFASIGRIDIASELRFDHGCDGLAFLHALSLADVPWAKVGTEGKKRDEIQTVNFRSVRGRTILLRAYDKGVESKTASPGEIVRLERQRRFRKTAEILVADTSTLNVQELFVGRELAALAQVVAERVCDVWGAVERLNDLTVEQRIRAPKADALAGFLIRRGAGHRPSTWYARWADLRSLGILVDPLARDRMSVPVGHHLRSMIEALAA